MRKIVFILSVLALVFPLTLNSADVFESSGGRAKIVASLNPAIVPGNSKLSSTVFVVRVDKKYQSVGIESDCTHSDNILYHGVANNSENLFVIQSNFPIPCDMPSVRIRADGNIFTDTMLSLDLQNEWKQTVDLMDYPEDELVNRMRLAEEKKIALSEKIDTLKQVQDIASKLTLLRAVYLKNSADRESDAIRHILDERTGLTYISPVAWYSVPEKPNLEPGAGRGYRRDVTDGIHHGWDVLAPYGTPVRALADGIIIRIVNDWKWSMFDQIKHGTLSDDDKLTNLDIYRGNQIWLKTYDGNVVFYSHLSHIRDNLSVGQSVTKWETFGAIGTSGVPDRNYKDVHLHFEIQQNPGIGPDASVSPLSVMRWDYVGKNLSRNGVLGMKRKYFP